MTPQTVIDDVRVLINDTDATDYRYSDVDLVKFVNEALKRTAHLRPDLFASITTMVCAVSTTVQSAPSDSLRFIELLQVVGGNAPYESDRKTMDQHSPGWRASAEGACTTWMRHPRNPNTFFIYPPSPAAGQTLSIEYSKIPADYTISETILELHDSYKSVIIDCVIFLSQSIDDEHVSTGRAKLFFDSFIQTLGVSAKTRGITDNEEGDVPVPPEDVVQKGGRR